MRAVVYSCASSIVYKTVYTDHLPDSRIAFEQVLDNHIHRHLDFDTVELIIVIVQCLRLNFIVNTLSQFKEVGRFRDTPDFRENMNLF